MFALQFHQYGGPDVLAIGEAPEPHAGPGQVRVAVQAVSVNPFDWKLRAGYLAGVIPLEFPAIPGTDAAGVVDEVGPGVSDVTVGDAVFGLGWATSAEFATLDLVARIPDGATFEQTAALGLVVETAARTLDLLDLPPGATLLIDGAAGGVGTAMTQLAVGRGLRVIGTASRGRHDYLRTLGASPTTYGSGLAARVAELAPDGVAGAVDLAGKGSVPELVTITGDARRVASTADFGAPALGAQVVDTSRGRAGYALAEAARLLSEGRFVMPVERTYPLAQGAQAHRHSETGHAQGKIVLTVP